MLGACLHGLEAQLSPLVRIKYSNAQAILTILSAAMGGIYEFVRFSSANLREKDDSYNPALGGFLAGSVLGLRRMSNTGIQPVGFEC